MNELSTFRDKKTGKNVTRQTIGSIKNNRSWTHIK